MWQFKHFPVNFQKRKHKEQQKEADIEAEQKHKDLKASEQHKESELSIKRRLENLPRFTYKVTRFYRHKDEMEKTMDRLRSAGIINLESKTLTENFVEEIYDIYMILPMEGSRIIKAAALGAVGGGAAGLFHGIGVIAIPLLNPASAGGAVVTTLLAAVLTALFTGTFTATARLLKPIRGVTPGYHALTVYGDLEEKKKILGILKDSVTVNI